MPTDQQRIADLELNLSKLLFAFSALSVAMESLYHVVQTQDVLAGFEPTFATAH
jgi:hypothetical protein